MYSVLLIVRIVAVGFINCENCHSSKVLSIVRIVAEGFI